MNEARLQEIQDASRVTRVVAEMARDTAGYRALVFSPGTILALVDLLDETIAALEESENEAKEA